MTTALTDSPAHEREETILRARVMVQVPQVRSRLMEIMSVTGRLLCRALVERTGRHEDDFAARAYAMGLMGALLETIDYWAEADCREDLPALIDRTLSTFKDLPRR